MGKGSGGCSQREALILAGETSQETPVAATEEQVEQVAPAVAEEVEQPLEMQLLDAEESTTEEEEGAEIITSMNPEELKKDKEAWKKHLQAIKKKKAAEAEAKRKARDKILAEVLKEEGEDALVSMNPLALQAKLVEGTDTDQKDILLVPCVEVKMTVNPVFDAVLQKLGAIKRGKRNYSFFANPDVPKDNLAGLLKALPANQLYSEEVWKESKLSKKGGHASNQLHKINGDIAMTSLGKTTNFENFGHLHANHHHYPDSGKGHSAILFSRDKNELHFKVMTQKDKAAGDRGQLNLYPGAPNLHTMKENGLEEGQIVTIPEALSLVGAARNKGIRTVVDPRIHNLKSKTDDAVLIRPVPGAPGKAEVVLGENVQYKGKDFYLNDLPGQWGATSIQLPAKEAAKLLKDVEGHKEEFMDPRVEDILVMQDPPKVEIDGLMPHQNEAVALHLATKSGFLNACEMGMGKTPMSLTGCEQKWLRKEKEGKPYRALVAAEKSLVGQWQSEAGKFFPGAKVFILEAGKAANLAKLGKELENQENAETPYPLVVMTTYSLAKGMSVLKMYRWDDIIVDEAAFLKNPASNRSQSFWDLRENADCAVALTGTPIDKGLDDIGSILSWVRNDTSLFQQNRLSDDYDITDNESLKKLNEAMGPVIFRRDQSEISDKIPKVTTRVHAHQPHETELDLSNGAKTQLKKLLQELEEQTQKDIKEALAKGEMDQEEAEEMQALVKSMRGQTLASLMIARKAASDPKSLEDSENTAVAMLDEAGLLEPAIKKGGTKRKAASKYIEKRIKEGHPTLVFTEFLPLADNLVKELQDKDLKVGTIQGDLSTAERGKIQAQFQGVPCEKHHRRAGAVKDCAECTQPTLDVLVLTKAANKGLNLQRASTLVHYDMSWVPSDYGQRVGRARRIGSDNEEIESSIFLMKDTIEERIGAILVPRAMQALMALDANRGTDISKNAYSGMSQEFANNLGEDYIEDQTASIIKLAKEMVLNEK